VDELEPEQEGNHGLELRIDDKFQRLVFFFVRVGEPPLRHEFLRRTS
jgi:hypothetical protein